MPEGASGSATVMMMALMDMELIPLLSLPASAPASYTVNITAARSMDTPHPVNIVKAHRTDIMTTDFILRTAIELPAALSSHDSIRTGVPGAFRKVPADVLLRFA